MMAGKAKLFSDQEIREQILKCSDPKQIKALGRKVRRFDQKVWDKFKYAIVLNGNWCKFSQNRNLREFLLSTGDSVLAEASPYDAIWGIRLAASSPEAQSPMKWRGQNLLGFALMEVRDELRRVTQNEMLCYHIGTELTCAEAMFMACNEYYHLNLSEETRKMFSVMGLGMQTEHSCCGAFTVAVGIIGLMTAKEGQTDVSNMEGYQMIAELTEFMLGFYGTLHCVELQKLEIVGVENPCHAIVEALAKKLEELLTNRRIFCPANGGQLSC